MEFCNTCSNYLHIVEDRQDGNFRLIYRCNSCNITRPCTKTIVYKKVYKNDDLNINDVYLNKYHARDKTLPTKLSTCTHCKETNTNKYEVKYCNNSFNIIVYCNNCTKAFKYKN